ncbi:unnamed protein product [Blepharisma stoltei]|uniref:Uncharacterized protein n=1 Tax=Blepharisma stoltei TaxID=1481888 RepID=A0AAU9K869_9CILI|nr:unnamed protein product [Blepharisma stoltei]
MRKTLSKARLKSNQHHILVKRYLNMLMLYEPSLEGLLLRAIEDPSCTLTSLILGLTLALTSGLLAGDYWSCFDCAVASSSSPFLYPIKEKN